MSWAFINLYLNNFFIEILNFLDTFMITSAKLMAFFDLLVDISETFALILVASITIINQIPTLASVHNIKSSLVNLVNLHTPNGTSVPNLYLVNTISTFLPKSYYWLNFK